MEDITNCSSIDYIYVDVITRKLGLEGGWCCGGGKMAYVGWYHGTFDGNPDLTESKRLHDFIRTLYIHEFDHFYGWEHGGWVSEKWDSDEYLYYRQNLSLVDPILFGWLDTDGDSIPEAVDPTPYGILNLSAEEKTSSSLKIYPNPTNNIYDRQIRLLKLVCCSQ